VAGLMLDPAQNSPVAKWFGVELATNGLPELGQWFNAYRGEQALLQLAIAADADLSAGAVAALVGSVGGDEQAASDFLTTVKGLSDRSPRGVGDAWKAVRQSIFMRHLAQAAGRYRLTLN